MILGIDTARGWAIGEPGGRIEAAGTVKGVPEMIIKITELSEQYDIEQVRIERPGNRHVYQRPGVSEPAMKKIAVNVGENREKASALYYYCKGLGLNPVFVNPIRGGTKMNARQIEMLTGWKEATSEHSRDAIVICWIKS